LNEKSEKLAVLAPASAAAIEHGYRHRKYATPRRIKRIENDFPRTPLPNQPLTSSINYFKANVNELNYAKSAMRIIWPTRLAESHIGLRD
jgi:hypothetical protein